jgi:hypothetical protein
MTAGSDAHTLRRIGRTFVDVPGVRTADEFLTALARGEGRPHGAHGSVTALTADIYGVVTRYVLSLAGVGPSDHSLAERLAFGAFSLVSAPCQFLPFAVACQFQWQQRRFVAAAGDLLVPPAAPAAGVAIEASQ